MSLYKDASLVMIPSAYKDGKLYSIRPTDGSGDFTFSRGTTATRVDVNGLIEKGRENIILWSEDIDNATWLKSNITITANTDVAPNGTTTADKATHTSASGDLYQLSADLNAQDVFTYSFYAKYVDTQWVRGLIGSTQYVMTWFDVQNGVLGTNAESGNSTYIDSSMTDVGNGWYRCTITAKNGVSSGNYVTINTAAANGSSTRVVGSFLYWGVQTEKSLVATDYIETGASTAQAGILEDMPRLDYSGGASCPALLLEPQRVNNVTDSEYYSNWTKANTTITSNDAISPEGYLNASKYQGDGTNSVKFLYKSSGSTTIGNDYTWSAFVKKGTLNYCQLIIGSATFDTALFSNFDLLNGTIGSNGGGAIPFIESYGNDWYRVGITATANANGTATPFIVLANSATMGRVNGFATSDYIYVYGAQFEQGSYPTSYIPTYGASVTRSSESQDATGLNTSVFNNDNFTLFYDFDYNADGREGSTTAYRIFSGSSQLGIKGRSGSSRSMEVYSSGDFSGSIVFNNIANASRIKVALRVTNGTCELFFNGAKDSETIDVSGAAPYNWAQITMLGSSSLNTSLNQCLGFPTALTDAEAIALTTL